MLISVCVGVLAWRAVAVLVRAVVALGVVAGLVPAVVALGVVAVWRQWLILRFYIDDW